MPHRPMSGWRHQFHEVVFEADTPAGKIFDVTLLVAIVVSVAIVMLESVGAIRDEILPNVVYDP